MTPLQEALYLTAKEGEDFWATAMLTGHQGGIVILTPEAVLIAQRETSDTLFIWCCVGRGAMAQLCKLAPVGTKWLKWWRGLRVDDPSRVVQFPFERVARLVSHSAHP